MTYGFVAAMSLRTVERDHEYHSQMHDFAEQTERIFMMVLLVLLGGAVVNGLLLALDWKAVVFTALTLLLLRPLCGWVGLLGLNHAKRERAVIAFYGIRGLGSVYYLTYALDVGIFAQPEYLWAVVGLVIIVSIIFHGATVTPVMRRLDRSTAATTRT